MTAPGRLLIDRSKVNAEERLDGKYLLCTSDPDLTAEDVALGYKNPLEAERGFRDLKSTLQLRPVFHRLERRIRARILLCWLALLMIRLAERQTEQTWRRIALELGRLHLVTLTGPVRSVTHTTTLTATQREILTALKIDPPPRGHHAHPRLSRAPLDDPARVDTRVRNVTSPRQPRLNKGSRPLAGLPRAHQLRNSGKSLRSRG